MHDNDDPKQSNHIYGKDELTTVHPKAEIDKVPEYRNFTTVHLQSSLKKQPQTAPEKMPIEPPSLKKDD